MFDTRIDDRNEFDTLSRKFFTQRLWIRETGSIPGEHAIALHVVNIKMNDVEWQSVFAILADNFFNHRVGIRAPAALLVTQRPQWRHGHVPGEVRVSIQNLLERRSVEEVIVQLAALGAKPNTLLRRFAEVEITPIAVIEKDAVSITVLQSR